MPGPKGSWPGLPRQAQFFQQRKRTINDSGMPIVDLYIDVVVNFIDKHERLAILSHVAGALKISCQPTILGSRLETRLCSQLGQSPRNGRKVLKILCHYEFETA